MVQINTLNPSCGCEYGKTQHIVTLIYLFYHMLWLSNKPSQYGWYEGKGRKVLILPENNRYLQRTLNHELKFPGHKKHKQLSLVT